MNFVKSAISVVALTMAGSTFATGFQDDYKEKGDVEFTREVPEIFGIEVIDGKGEIAFNGEDDRKAAKVKVLSNAEDGKLKLSIKTIEKSSNIEDHKIIYRLEVGDKLETFHGKKGDLVVNSGDIIEIWPSYKDEITDVTAGQAMFKAELSVESD